MKLDGPIAHLVDKADRETLQGSLETRVAEVSSKSITRHRPFADPLFHAQGKHHVGRRLGRQALTSNSESDIYKTERDGETSLINLLTPVPPVTGHDKSWPLFHV